VSRAAPAWRQKVKLKGQLGSADEVAELIAFVDSVEAS